MSSTQRAADLPTIRRELFYGGSFRASLSGEVLPTVNPANGQDLGSVPAASAADVDSAVNAAGAGFRCWRRVVPADRAAALREMARRLRVHAEDLALIDTLDSGGPIAVMRRDVETSAQTLEFFAGLVTEIKGETIPFGDGNLNYTVREPWGVVGCILAYNHPLLFAVGRIAPALAAGNSVVVKPADQTPLSALHLAEIWADVLPAGVFNVVTGDRACGAALAGHPGIAKSSLVGSIATGKAVMRAAAEHVRPVALELGGKNAMIVCPDARKDAVVAAAVMGMNLALAGQSCGSITRIFLHDSIHDEMVSRIAEAVAAVRPGLPELDDTRMGPLISAAQREKVMDYIRLGREEGATLRTGGGIPDDPRFAGGYYVEPTVFSDVTMDMRLAREEIFGPVLSILRWSDEETVLGEANMLDYGLTASVFTQDLETAHRLASRVEAGYVWVNQVGYHFLGAPFGGAKQSGLGREECLDELLDCTQVKNVNIRFLGA